jgi:AcrR family transcriptional regulator
MNHDMTSDRARGPLRDRQQAATRQAIIAAFLDLARRENTVAISIPAVARRAGLSVRTVYRYFATKSDLQTAAALNHDQRARTAIDASQIDRIDVGPYLRQLWTGFAADIPGVAAEHCTPAGRDLRATRLDSSRRIVRAALPPVTADEVVDLIVAMTSSSMFLELVDRMGHRPDRAAAMVTELVELVVGEAAAAGANCTGTEHEEDDR